jgi:hypothetical protein
VRERRGGPPPARDGGRGPRPCRRSPSPRHHWPKPAGGAPQHWLPALPSVRAGYGCGGAGRDGGTAYRSSRSLPLLLSIYFSATPSPHALELEVTVSTHPRGPTWGEKRGGGAGESRGRRSSLCTTPPSGRVP